MTRSALRVPTLACLALLLAACSKAPEPPPPVAAPPPVKSNLVPAAEQSPHFQDVDKHLELGGTLYGYVDVDGDALSLARQTQALAKQMVAATPQLSMFAKQDFAALFTALGFDDIKAVGVSSVRETSGQYRNRTFLYTPAGRQGLLAVFGGSPGPFSTAKLAPADADFYCEHELDLKAVYDTVEGIVGKVQGPDAAASFRAQVKKIGADASISLLDLLLGLRGRATVILRFDGDRTMTLPGNPGFVIPATSGLVRIEGIGDALEGVLKGKPNEFHLIKDGKLRIYAPAKAPKVEGFDPVFAFEDSTFYLAWSEGFLTECLGREHGLDADPAFTKGLAALGPNGNGLTWVTPRLFERVRDLERLNPGLPPVIHRALDFYAANLPTLTEPLLSVRTNLPDGILIRSHWNRSLKADLALLTIYNPVTLGFLAAGAIPAFQKARQNTQAQAVLHNLEQLHRATAAYCTAHQVEEATYDQLVGPGELVENIAPVVGEDYRALTYRNGQTLSIRLPDGRRISYPPNFGGQVRTLDAKRRALTAAGTAGLAPPPGTGPQNPRDRAITENLRTLYDAAQRYYAENGTTAVTYDQLVGPDKLVHAIAPVEGESYRSLLFKQGFPLRLHLRDGRELVYPVPDSP